MTHAGREDGWRPIHGQAMAPLGIRWTVGDVSSRGWEALRLSVHCAVQLFGEQALYTICVNSVDLETARARTGAVPEAVVWREITAVDIPSVLRAHFSPAMAEGVGWKLAPAHIYPDRHELALDNDCILWALPVALKAFLAEPDRTLLAQDVERCLGRFQNAPVPGAINSGIRGLPPHFPLEHAMRDTLDDAALGGGEPLLLCSELDEQGLQAAALQRRSPSLLVQTDEVSICSPFWPRQPALGSCGAHFVGLNARHLPWNYYHETADRVRRRHWDEHRPKLFSLAGLALTDAMLHDEE